MSHIYNYNQPSEQVPPYNPDIAQESAHNLAILHEPLKHDFINAVNTLTGKSYMLLPPVEIHGEYPYGMGEGFPEDHEFYKTVYDYLRQNNPSLLNDSIFNQNDGVTNSEVAFYMIDQAQRNEIRYTTRRATLTTTPEGDTTVKETAQNLSGLKALIVKEIQDPSLETPVLQEIEDIEQKKDSIINSPANFNISRTKEIQDVLSILPPEVDRVFTEKMLNYLLIGGLVQNGVIPYIDMDGVTKLDFTPQCSPQLKSAWQPAAGNANAFIPPETLKGFMAYTSTKQSPNETMRVIKSRLPNNTAPTAANILQAASIPNSQKSLALTTLKNNNSTAIIEPLVGQAATDAAKFKRANISDTLQMVTNQTSQFEDLAKKGQLPKNNKEWADLVRSPVSEAGKRFGAGGSILVLFGTVMLAWKAGKALANKMSGGEAKWFGKTLGFVTALAGFSVGSNILGNFIENIPLEKVDPNKSDKEKKKLERQFTGCVGAFFTDVFPGLFILSEGFGRDANNLPFGESVTAEEIFSHENNGAPRAPFSLHPNVIDQKTELTIDGKKATPQMLDSYKAVYRTVYFRRKNLIAARDKESDPAKREAIFPGNLLDPGTQTLGQYLGGFYKEIKNKNELPRAEGFDMDPKRIRNFGLSTVPIMDQGSKVAAIDTKFNTTTAAFTLYPVPSMSTYDKKPFDIKLGTAPNEDILQIPLWDPAELKDDTGNPKTPSYEWAKDGADYLVQITDNSIIPARISQCVLSETSPGSQTYTVKQMSINGVAYTK